MPVPLCPSQDLWRTSQSILPCAPVSLSSLAGVYSAQNQSPSCIPSTKLIRTLSPANLSKASVKLLEASSLCILIPVFCESALASYIRVSHRLSSSTVWRTTDLESIKLNVCIPVGKALDHSSDGIFRTVLMSVVCPYICVE